MAEHLEEETQRTPSSASVRAGPSAASVDSPYLAEHLEEEAKRLPSRAVAAAGPSARRAPPANVPEPRTTQNARKLLNENEKVIG